MPIIEPQPLPEKKPKTNIFNLRELFNNIGFKIIKGAIHSYNYVASSAGWKLTNNGDFEANSGTFRGNLVANSVDIPDTTTANSFHVNNTGDAWWGAAAIGSALAKILKTGVATFTDVTITGGSMNIGSGKTQVSTTGISTFKDFNLLQQYTAGEALTKGHLGCLKHKIATWGNDASANRNTTALLSAFTYVDEESPNDNYSADLTTAKLGTKFTFSTGISYQHYIYGKIDLTSNPPGLPAWNEIERVFLRLYVIFASGTVHTGGLYRLTSSFDEATITWNTKPADDSVGWCIPTTEVYLSNDPAATADLTSTGYIDFDITELYRLWSAGKLTNNGFAIKMGASPGGVDIAASTIGGRTRTGGGAFNQAPYSLQIITKDNPGSGNTITANDGKVYHASDSDYNLVKNIVGVIAANADAAATADVYTLADKSLVPTSVFATEIGKYYYLDGTDGTITSLTNDIIKSGEWNKRIGIGVSNGLLIDYDKNPVFIKSVTYPGTGILPPPQARMAIVANGTTSQCILYKDRVTSTPLASWASGTSGLLTSTAGYVIYFYK